jgi:type II secretory pathway pseudopilin PulG
MAPAKSRSNRSSGFSLTEVMIAMGLLTAVSLGIAQLFAVSTRANRVARDQTSTTAVAAQKMEQLRSLTWGFDTAGQGLPVTDTTTNLAFYPHRANGTGLNPTPPNTLEENVPGYVDYLDGTGAWVGTGEAPPSNAVFVRRWAIVPLPTNPNNTIVLRVLVSTVSSEASRGGAEGARRRMPGDTLLTGVKTRKAS